MMEGHSENWDGSGLADNVLVCPLTNIPLDMQHNTVVFSSSHYGMYSSSMLEWVDFFQNWFVLLEDVATVLDRDPVTAGVRQRFPSAVLASRRTACAWL